MKKEFKGTKGKFYAVQYGSMMILQDGPMYEDKNILDIEDVGQDNVIANVDLLTASPIMFSALENIRDNCKILLKKLEQEDPDLIDFIRSTDFRNSVKKVNKALERAIFDDKRS